MFESHVHFSLLPRMTSVSSIQAIKPLSFATTSTIPRNQTWSDIAGGNGRFIIFHRVWVLLLLELFM
jgi:hypothetical protein